MTVTWRATDLSVSPPSFQMADTDRQGLQFDAGEELSTATASLTNLETGTEAPILVTDDDFDLGIATVVVENLTRGVTYELAVTFERADGRAWTRTLVIECVA